MCMQSHPTPCAGAVEGFAVDENGAAAPAWAVAFPPQEESILALAAPDLHSPVYSYAKARLQPVSGAIVPDNGLDCVCDPRSKAV